MSFPIPKISFISSGDIDPPPSSSNKAKAVISFSSLSKFYLFIVAITHSLYSISPLPSASATARILSTSSSEIPRKV